MKSKIMNFGSINIDHVYQVPHFVTLGKPYRVLILLQAWAARVPTNQRLLRAQEYRLRMSADFPRPTYGQLSC
jgi:hypothetical protein